MSYILNNYIYLYNIIITIFYNKKDGLTKKVIIMGWNHL